MRQTITFTIQIDVDAEAAAKLPAYPGTGNPGAEYGDVDIAISGLEIEAQMIAQDIAVAARDALPHRLGAVIVSQGFTAQPVLESALL